MHHLLRSAASLIVTLCVFFILLAFPPLLERLFVGAVTGRGLLGSMLLVAAYTALVVLRGRCCEAEREPARQRRGTRGESCGTAIAVALLLVLAVLVLVRVCAAAGPAAGAADPVDAMMVDAAARLFPGVPLSGAELADLQAIALATARLVKVTQAPIEGMPPEVRNQRLLIRRDLERAHSAAVEAMVQHAGAVIQATRKGVR